MPTKYKKSRNSTSRQPRKVISNKKTSRKNLIKSKKTSHKKIVKLSRKRKVYKGGANQKKEPEHLSFWRSLEKKPISQVQVPPPIPPKQKSLPIVAFTPPISKPSNKDIIETEIMLSNLYKQQPKSVPMVEDRYEDIEIVRTKPGVFDRMNKFLAPKSRCEKLDDKMEKLKSSQAKLTSELYKIKSDMKKLCASNEFESCKNIYITKDLGLFCSAL
jgi:hypothetical protein